MSIATYPAVKSSNVLQRGEGGAAEMVSVPSSAMRQVQVPVQRVSGTTNSLQRIQHNLIRNPVVLIPDLRDVLLKRVRLPRPRLPMKEIRRSPLKKVDPVPLREREKRETSVSLPSRRNAGRACKTGSPPEPDADTFQDPNDSDQGSTAIIASNSYVRSRSRNLRRRRGKRVTRDDSVEVAQEVGFCKFCNKKFNVADFALEHEVSCFKNPIVTIHRQGDFRDNKDAKVNFMECLQLKPTHDDEKAKVVDDKEVVRGGSTDSKRQRLERSQVLKQFRTFPLPFSSLRGQKIIAEARVLGHNHDESQPREHDQDCYAVKTRGRTNWPTSLSKKRKNKKDEYTHRVSFNKRQRIERNSEIILGLSRKSWKNLNKCKNARVMVKRLTSAEIVKVLSHHRVPTKLEQILGERLQVKLDDITSQPWFLKRFPTLSRTK